MVKERLLIVDDEDNLRSMLRAALSYNGFDVFEAINGREALAMVAQVTPDLMILDVMMPDLDGFAVCQRLRRQGNNIPILFLTAKGDTTDRVRGLTIGADDYLQKPFSLDELVARCRAVLRRNGSRGGLDLLTCADLHMDDAAHRVTRGGLEVQLSPTEYNLLHYLLTNQGIALSKSQILDAVWHYDFDGEVGVVETYIGYLRRKIDNGEPKLIHTIRGVGYSLRER